MRFSGTAAGLAGAGAAVLLLVSGCSHADQSGALPAISGQTGSGEPAPASTTTRPARSAPTLPPTTPPTSDSSAARRDAAKLKSDGRAAKKKIYFTMPRLVGRNLQASQDTLQSLGSYLLNEADASGQGRKQILDRDWKVCSQKPAAGKKVPIIEVVTLWSVRTSERCP